MEFIRETLLLQYYIFLLILKTDLLKSKFDLHY